MALWTRKLDHFGVSLEWRGDDRVYVTADGDGDIDVVKTDNGSNDPAAIGKLMKRTEEELHEAATAMG